MLDSLQIMPLDSVWKGTYDVPSIDIVQRVLNPNAIYLKYSILAFFVVCILFHKIILDYLKQLFSSLFFSKDIKFIVVNKSLLKVHSCLFIPAVCVITSITLFFFCDIVKLSFFPLLGIIIGVVLFKYIIISVLKVSPNYDTFRYCYYTSLSYFIFIALFALILTLIIGTFGISSNIAIMFSILIGLLYILYIKSLIEIFFSRQVSLFFIFLYLCTLEFLPVTLLVVVSLNI